MEECQSPRAMQDMVTLRRRFYFREVSWTGCAVIPEDLDPLKGTLSEVSANDDVDDELDFPDAFLPRSDRIMDELQYCKV